MEARKLRFRLTFQRRVFQSDGYGNAQGDFEDQFSEWAAIEPRLGGESILAGRLTGRNAVNITVRKSSETASVTEEWRAVDSRDTTKVYNIRSIIEPPDSRGRWIEMLAEIGVAT
jgi:SPP1 family predicted phage head-tail adaptor